MELLTALLFLDNLTDLLMLGGRPWKFLLLPLEMKLALLLFLLSSVQDPPRGRSESVEYSSVSRVLSLLCAVSLLISYLACLLFVCVYCHFL